MLGAPRGGAGANEPPTAGLSERRSRPRGEADERAEAPGSKGGLGGRASVAAGRRVCVCRRSRVVCVWTGRQETASVGRAVRCSLLAYSFALPFSSLSLSLGGGPRAPPSPRRGRRPLAPLHPSSLAPTMAANAQDSQAPLRGQEFKKDEDREDDGVLFFKRGGGEHRARSLNKHAPRAALAAPMDALEDAPRFSQGLADSSAGSTWRDGEPAPLQSEDAAREERSDDAPAGETRADPPPSFLRARAASYRHLSLLSLLPNIFSRVLPLLRHRKGAGPAGGPRLPRPPH